MRITGGDFLCADFDGHSGLIRRHAGLNQHLRILSLPLVADLGTIRLKTRCISKLRDCSESQFKKHVIQNTAGGTVQFPTAIFSLRN